MSTHPIGDVSKKIYFIKRPKPGHELTTLLKNKFKSLDAVRDVLSWFGDKKSFQVILTDWDPEFDDELPPAIPLSPALPEVVNHKNMTIVVDSIIKWLDAGRDFDISLVPTDRFAVNLN